MRNMSFIGVGVVSVAHVLPLPRVVAEHKYPIEFTRGKEADAENVRRKSVWEKLGTPRLSLHACRICIEPSTGEVKYVKATA